MQSWYERWDCRSSEGHPSFLALWKDADPDIPILQQAATRMAQAGVDLATLAAILGHSSIRMVQKYVHPTAEHKKSAMLRYDRVSKEMHKKVQQEGERRTV